MMTTVDRTCRTCKVDRGQLILIRDARGDSRLLCHECAEAFNTKANEKAEHGQYHYFDELPV